MRKVSPWLQATATVSLGLALPLAATPASAQDNGARTLEEPDLVIRTFKRAIEEGQKAAEFQLPIAANGALDILVSEAEDPRLDPVVEVYGADGDLIVRDDDGGPGMSAFARVFSATAQQLRVVVKLSGDGQADATIPFEIQLRDSDFRPPDPDDFERLTLSDAEQSLPSTAAKEFVFSGMAGDVWVFELTRDEGDGDPILDVFDFRSASTTPLMTDDDGGEGLNSRLVFRIPSNDNYRLRARAISEVEGTFTLKVFKPEPRKVQPTREIGVGETLVAEIVADPLAMDEGPYADFKLSESAWDALSAGEATVDLKRQDGGEGDPLLQIGLITSMGFAVLESNDDIGNGNLDSRLRANLAAMTEVERKAFRIRAKATAGSVGTFDLTVTAAE